MFTEPTYEAVGFTAYAPEGTSYYNYKDIVIFDATVNNIGGYYDTSSSQFLCPADGMYGFSLNVLTAKGTQLTGNIMKESTALASVSGNSISDVYNGVSNLVITVCGKGERVWVRCFNDGAALHGSQGYRYTTFSGFLLNRL